MLYLYRFIQIYTDLYSSKFGFNLSVDDDIPVSYVLSIICLVNIIKTNIIIINAIYITVRPTATHTQNSDAGGHKIR